MKSNLPRISIITPSFNQGKFIEQTIQSALSQNYPNLEYIVMDGGSSDNTVEILKKYEGKIKWFSEKDKGQSDAINKGFKIATGDIIAWLNSDDYYLPGTLKKVGEYFMNKDQAQWVTGDYEIVNENGRQIQSFVRTYKNILRVLPFNDTLYVANYINQPSTFWKRELLNEVGFVNEEYHLCMDYDLWLRIYKKYPLHTISSPLSAFRIHSTSKGKNLYKKQFEEELEVARKNGATAFALTLHSLHSYLVTKVYNAIK
jgi:glycosyltransferase involved in cell wall biosynthesis